MVTIRPADLLMEFDVRLHDFCMNYKGTPEEFKRALAEFSAHGIKEFHRIVPIGDFWYETLADWLHDILKAEPGEAQISEENRAKYGPGDW